MAEFCSPGNGDRRRSLLTLDRRSLLIVNPRLLLLATRCGPSIASHLHRSVKPREGFGKVRDYSRWFWECGSGSFLICFHGKLLFSSMLQHKNVKLTNLKQIRVAESYEDLTMKLKAGL
ncbi:hypothetical protein RIF29_14638 [Crotalaria pallida]|uniref:Uncharacterized protein n=1 Tax=Crotalaria pallida TaxID=3830 RepID=A0AAN9FBM7_CROPI